MATILFAHAFPLDASMWDEQVAALSEEHQVLAPHFPGFGGSNPSEDLTMATMADFLASQLDDAGADRAVVCGLSMGSYVTFELWRRHRNKIAGLLLADGRAEADDEAGREKRRGLAQKVRDGGPQVVVDSPPALLSEGVDPALWDHVKGIIAKQPAEAIALAALGMAERPDSTETLASIDVPTTVLVGSADALTPPALSEKVAKGIPGAELVVLEGAGHLSNLEAPEGFLAALRSLLDRVR